MENQKYDIGIIGGGVAGIISALTARRMGKSVVIFEKNAIGGACFNWGCLPSQEIISFGKLYGELGQIEKKGILNIDTKKLKLNWKKLTESAFAKSRDNRKYVESLMDNEGIELVQGPATVVDVNQIETGDGIYHVENLIIATGGRYILPDFVKSGTPNFFTPMDIYKMESLPKSITILGAGVLGIEYAMLFATLGCEVTIVEKDERLMSYLDDDLRNSLIEELCYRRIALKLNHNAIDFNDKGLLVNTSEGEVVVESDAYVNAIRRKGNLEGVARLIERGLSVKDGYIKTDLRCRTSLKGVYAVGDVNGRVLLAHVAANEAEVAVKDIAGAGEDMIYEMAHYNMYSFPQFASVGMTETVALEAGFLVTVVKIRLNWDGQQFAKIVYDKVSQEVLGVHIYADNANDLIVESVHMMELGATIDEFSKLVRSHPIHSLELVDKLVRG